jgi:hypothetical protein
MGLSLGNEDSHRPPERPHARPPRLPGGGIGVPRSSLALSKSNGAYSEPAATGAASAASEPANGLRRV